jgi:hypothetical protein
MKVALYAICALALAACAAPPFAPTTREGAQCKKECATNQQSCHGSSMTCDKGYANCIQACIDMERVSKK